MKKKLFSLYCTFVPYQSFESDFFIVELTFAFYEKNLFSEEKTSQFFVLLFLKAETFTKMSKNRLNPESFCPRNFLPLKYLHNNGIICVKIANEQSIEYDCNILRYCYIELVHIKFLLQVKER